MITKEAMEKAAKDWFELRCEEHSQYNDNRYVPGSYTELWLPKDAVPELAFQAGVKWALEEIEKVKK